jgi:asparagine synthase (glutamine-hydrolysing)
MCGITGIFAFNQVGRLNMINLAKATEAIGSRGPDNQGHFHNDFVGLGHRRLSIIDTSHEANQPMADDSGRYHIIYNGEIYNYKQLRLELEASGFQFSTSSDTEVLLILYTQLGAQCLNKLNGFFSFAIYDNQANEIFIARDRFGIKPLHYYQDQDKVLFGSEVKSILAYGIEKEIDFTTLYTYLQLNYIPAPKSILKGIKKLLPGHYLTVNNEGVQVRQYYNVNQQIVPFTGNFNEAITNFRALMEESVVSRLVSDVPLGTFLSGGVDSTVVSAIAARHVDKLRTFSIGFKDEPFFDETNYANKAAKLLNTEHTVFKLTNNDLYQHVFDMLDYLDEPFADSSALAVYILSKETRRQVTVALSGDGADELFAGYNKHAALLKMQHKGWQSNIAEGLAPLWEILPKSRNNVLTNKFRQLDRFAKAAKMNPAERYWALAALADEAYASHMLEPISEKIDQYEFSQVKNYHTAGIGTNSTITDNLMADLNLVLPNDMLTKVDLMSMAHGLEIRVPFLDHRVVEFAFGLPDEMKITANIRKRIVQEAFRSWMPKEIYNRPKKGFEVPLLKWFRTEMRSLINNDLLADDFIASQGIFSVSAIRNLKSQLFSRSPGDAHARIWALIVFQWWWKKYF